MLDKFIKVNDWTTMPILFFEEDLKFPQLIKSSHIFKNLEKIKIPIAINNKRLKWINKKYAKLQSS